MTILAPPLDELKHWALSDLKGLYKDLVSDHLPSRPSREFLLGNIVWALQVKMQQQDPDKVRNQLVSTSGNKSIPAKARYMPGTRLIREWHGVTHEVVIEEKGFRWQGQSFGNLSQIAREITGTRWSGPRFFGLNGNAAVSKGSVPETEG